LSSGSRAICFAKRTLEIFDRLGCGDRMVDKGVSWNVGRLFFRDEEIYHFDLLAEAGHSRPAFINLQQYYVEGFLAERAAQLPMVDIRWKSAVSGVEVHDDHAVLTVDTPDGPYRLEAQYTVACDGSRSSVRRSMGLESKGQTFRDRFLIADVKMTAPFPSERWFWFDPPFHRNQSVLLHRQPDDVWRIDFQLGWDADPEEEKKPENIVPRVKALLGDDAEFTLEWASVYTFSCQRMDDFRHGPVLFAGDSAHGVSPFGARGANSGVQDADNLGWKLAAVLRGEAGDSLLDSYAAEREFAADENIRNSTRATDFITPKTEISRMFRDAVLDLAKSHPFARTLVNSGRLSVPSTLAGSSLNTPDVDAFEGKMVPGAVAADAPVRVVAGASMPAESQAMAGDCSDHSAAATANVGGWLLPHLGGVAFTVLVFGDLAKAQSLAAAFNSGSGAFEGLEGSGVNRPSSRSGSDLPAAPSMMATATRVQVVAIIPPDAPAASAASASSESSLVVLQDIDGLAARRYDARPGTVYLLRPDQHVCARFRDASAAALQAAVHRALGEPSAQVAPTSAPPIELAQAA
ncbi:MAG: putativev FAD-dependent monooxygenase, partial [Rhizobacter sp.]|nr:putativev FAD-dependent monooxygenase [Rhizobacter sp.]